MASARARHVAVAQGGEMAEPYLGETRQFAFGKVPGRWPMAVFFPSSKIRVYFHSSAIAMAAMAERRLRCPICAAAFRSA